MIRTMRYVDVDDFPEEAGEAYRKLVTEAGINSGERIPWEIGREQTWSSYINKEEVHLIENTLKSFGLKDGEDIWIIFEW